MNGADFIRNCNARCQDELTPYIDQHVAWSLDGTRIMAHGKEWEDLFHEMERLGLKSSDYIPDPAVSFLGRGSLQ